MLLSSFELAKVKTSIAMGKLYVPMNLAANVLAKFCRPVLFYNEGSDFDLTLRGSSFLFRHRGRNFLVCTSHQLGNGKDVRSPSEMVIAVAEPDDKMIALTANGSSRAVLKNALHSNAEDILIMEFERNRSGRDLNPLFFDLDVETVGTLDNVPTQDVHAIFAIGYQSSSTDYEPVFNSSYELLGTKIMSRWSKLYLKPVEAGSWLPALRIGLEVHDNQYEATAGSPSYDPDGFSGAPVLFIYKDTSSQRHLGFAGIITHADKFGRFAIYRAAHIAQFMGELAALS